MDPVSYHRAATVVLEPTRSPTCSRFALGFSGLLYAQGRRSPAGAAQFDPVVTLVDDPFAGLPGWRLMPKASKQRLVLVEGSVTRRWP